MKIVQIECYQYSISSSRWNVMRWFQNFGCSSLQKCFCTQYGVRIANGLSLRSHIIYSAHHQTCQLTCSGGICSWLIHFLWIHFCLNLPGPPNFFMSVQYMQSSTVITQASCTLSTQFVCDKKQMNKQHYHVD